MSLFFLHSLVPGCLDFYWSELLKLEQWDTYVCPTSIEADNLIKVTNKLQRIRGYLKKPIIITSGLRPHLYNALIKGARHSSHLDGKAIDFQVVGMEANEVRAFLLPKLGELELRMEDCPGTNWIHIDTRVRHTGLRYFKP